MSTAIQIPKKLPSFKHIDLMLCISKEEKTVLFKKRYECYLAANAIEASNSEKMSDHYDELSSCYNQAAFHNGKLIGGIRGIIYDQGKSKDVPSFETYFEEINFEIGMQDKFLESCRFVIDESMGRSIIPSLALVRSNIILALATSCQHIITAARMKHVPFYESLGMKLVSASKVYPGLHVEMALLIGFDIQSTRYPFIEKYIDQNHIISYQNQVLHSR